MVSQDHYAAQLRLIADDAIKRGDADIPLSMEMHASFRSLLGGVAWLTQTRADIMVYVAAMQRVMAEPKSKHVIALNKVLKYIKRKPLKILYRAVKDPWRMLIISDSASSQRIRIVWP